MTVDVRPGARVEVADQIPEALRESLADDHALVPELFESHARRETDEPLRLKLAIIRGRLNHTRDVIAARYDGRSPSERDVHGAAIELAAGLAHGHQRAGAGGVDGERRAMEVEAVGDA